MRYYPAFLDLSGRPVVVVGGGAPAAQKARLLGRADADVLVLAPAPGPALGDLAAQGAVTLEKRDWRAEDFAGAAAVIAATGNRDEDARVARAAQAAGALANAVDQPGVSDFATPAIVERGDVVVGISTGGAAPALARRIRGAIERALPRSTGPLAALAREFRGTARALVPEFETRRRFWDRVFEGPVRDALEAGDTRLARERLVAELDGSGEVGPGIVHLVGAGPGDADLLTLKAARLLGEADVIIHDRLVSDDVLDLARRDARQIAVGKGGKGVSWGQDAINRLLLNEARAGRVVVRLKGGDPFLFGRGGEEKEYLERHGIAVSVVPGITAALGCGAAAGIPLTHRGHASAVTLVTGHGAAGEPTIDWPALAAVGGTLVFYMGVAAAPTIAARLMAEGVAPGRPVAVVERGTRPDQRVIRGRIADLAQLINENAVSAPALILIGEVAAEASVAEIADDLAIAV